MPLRADAPIFVPCTDTSTTRRNNHSTTKSRTLAVHEDTLPPPPHKPLPPRANRRRRRRRRPCKTASIADQPPPFPTTGTSRSNNNNNNRPPRRSSRATTTRVPLDNDPPPPPSYSSPWLLAARDHAFDKDSSSSSKNDSPLDHAASLDRPGWTVLRKGSSTVVQEEEEKAQSPQSNNNSEPIVASSTRRMEKLRDKWWAALQQQRQQQQQQTTRTEPSDHRKIPSVESSVCPFAMSSFVEEKEEGCCDDSTDSSSSQDDDHNNTVLEYYDKLTFPLHEAVRLNDERAVQELLLQKQRESLHNDELRNESPALSPLQLAVRLKLPKLVQILSRCNTVDVLGSSNTVHPLLLAVQENCEECLQILLVVFGTAASQIADNNDNTVFHISCGPGSHPSILELLLNHTAQSGNLFKCLSLRNNKEETPLHVACRNRRADLVDTFLNHKKTSNISFLSKLLMLVDRRQQTPLLAAVASDSTDIVMSFLMWRGNNVLSKKNRKSPCPLVWAVRHFNVDMILLLLEFNDGSSQSGLNLEKALNIAVGSNAEEYASEQLEILRILVTAGANPCAPSKENGDEVESAVGAAVHGRFTRSACVACLLDTYQEYLCRTREARRRDPRLQKQPDSFFTNIEAKENAEMKASTSTALADTLVQAFSRSHSQTCSAVEVNSHFYSTAMVLYRRGAVLDETQLGDVLRTIQAGISDAIPVQTLEPSGTLEYECQYIHTIGDFQAVKDPFHRKRKFRRAIGYLSRLFLTLPWASASLKSRSIQCPFFVTDITADCLDREKHPLQPDTLLRCSDGTCFLVHQVALFPSEKLSAAVRFATMCQNSDETTDGLLKISVEIEPRWCRCMLEHFYRGSVFSGLSTDTIKCCRDLLDLMLVAEEFLCPSLRQECEIRLLAPRAEFNRCFCCLCSSATLPCTTALTSHPSAQCTYRISSGASHLVSEETALDVLATVQSLVDECFEANCTLHAIQERDGIRISFGPLRQLLATALKTMLCRFGSVLVSSAFRSLVQESAADKDAVLLEETILHSCLCQLVFP